MNLRLFTKLLSRSRFNWNLKWIPQAVRALRAVKQNPILDKLKMSFTEGKKRFSFIYLPTFSFFASSTLVVTFFLWFRFSSSGFVFFCPGPIKNRFSMLASYRQMQREIGFWSSRGIIRIIDSATSWAFSILIEFSVPHAVAQRL